MDKNIVDYAFHMPITAYEMQRYKKIAELVRKDEFLPVSYRKPKKLALSINTKNMSYEIWDTL